MSESNNNSHKSKSKKELTVQRFFFSFKSCHGRKIFFLLEAHNGASGKNRKKKQ